MTYRFVSCCLGIALSICQATLHAQFETKQLAQSGLTMHWRTSIGGIGLRNGDSSITLWVSQRAQSEIVSVMVKVPSNHISRQSDHSNLRIRIAGQEGKPATFIKLSDGDRVPQTGAIELWKIIEQFKASDTDWRKVNAVSESSNPKLGSAGAKELAESVAETYRALKREVEIVSETLDSSYLVSVNRNALVTSVDAESGRIYWQNQLPSYDLNTFGPGVSDDFVAVVNGNQLLVYGLEFGNLVSTQKLQYVPTGKLLIWQDRVMVPSAGGRIVSYSAVDPTAAPTVLRLGLENRKSLTQSSDSRFFGWITDSRLIIAKHDELPRLWTSIDDETHVPGEAVAVDNGFVFLSEFGAMIRTNLTSNSPITWRRKFGIPTGSSPVVGRELVAFVSHNGLLVAADLATGLDAWERPIGGMRRILNITSDRIYAMDQSGKLSIVDAKAGRILGKIPSTGYVPLSNNINDRILLVSEFGELICLREQGAHQPTYTTSKVGDESNVRKSAEPSTPEKSPGETMSSGSSPFETEKSTNEQSLFDPFAG